MKNFWENKSGIYYEGTHELSNDIRKQKELNAALEQAKKPLSVKPSNISEAINTLSPKAAYPSTHSSLIELCASDETKAAPIPKGVPLYDFHAQMERHREWLLAEEVKAESALEVARMKVRDEHEARKQVGRKPKVLDWLPTKPEKPQGYNMALYSVLKHEHDEGRACPKPREVLEIFRQNKPACVTRVLPASFEYFSGEEIEERTVSLNAFGEAIRRMTKKPHE